MNRPEASSDHPPFDAPWQAQAFALAVHLNNQGLFSWKEWGDCFSAQRKLSAEQGVADRPDQYYLDWIAALEHLLAAKGAASAAALAELKQAWTEAYLHTPHGQPVTLP